MKSQSTVGAGDKDNGAMTLKLAENASLEEMNCFGVAASAATLNQGTRLCSHDEYWQKIYAYLSANKNIFQHWGNHHQPVGNAPDYAQKVGVITKGELWPVAILSVM